MLCCVVLKVPDRLCNLGEPLCAAAVAGHVVPDPLRPDLAGQQRLRRPRAEHPGFRRGLPQRRGAVP